MKHDTLVTLKTKPYYKSVRCWISQTPNSQQAKLSVVKYLLQQILRIMGKNKESSLESNDVSLVKLVVIQFYP